MESALIPALILCAAALYASVGHGGASGYLAVMALCGVAPETMRPTALVLNVLVSSIALVQFARAGFFRWQLFWPFGIVSAPCAYLGGRVPPSDFYRPLVGLVLLFAAWRLFVGAKAVVSATRRVPFPLALLVGAAIGLLSGLTGVGGGIFLSPILLLARWAEPRQASGVSAAFILVNSLAGLWGSRANVSALPPEITGWAVAAVVGGLVGASLGSRRLAGPTLRRLLALVLVVAGAKLLTGA